MIRRLRYFSVLHEFHHLLDVGWVVLLEVKAHIVVKFLHGSSELFFLGCLSITLKDMSVHLSQSTLESTHTTWGSLWVAAADVALSINSPGCAGVYGTSGHRSACPGTHVLFGLYFLWSYFLSLLSFHSTLKLSS